MSPDQTETQKSIGEIARQRIRRLRIQRQLTQENLCERAGVSIDAVSRIESGSRVPTLDTLERIAKALGVRVVDLVSTDELPISAYPSSLQRVINLLEGRSPSVHQMAERVLKAVIEVLFEAKSPERSLAAEEKAEYGRSKKKRI